MATSNDIVAYFATGNEVLYSDTELAKTKVFTRVQLIRVRNLTDRAHRQEYYEALCEAKPFEVRYTGPERGKAMFALRDIAKGETILEEYGWVGMQAVVNKVNEVRVHFIYFPMS